MPIIYTVKLWVNLYFRTKFNLKKQFSLEAILYTSDDSDIGFYLEVDLFYPDNKEEKTNKFPFAPENKKNLILKISHHFWIKWYHLFMHKVRT